MPASDLFRHLQQLEADADISLWTIDNSANGGTVYYFHSSNKNGIDTDLVHNSITYAATAIDISGIEQNGQTKPRPRMTLATLAAVQLGLLSDPDLLLGASCTRIKTRAKYLDAGSNPDPTAIEPTAKFFVQRLEKVVSKTSTTYQLSEPSDLPQTNVPRRRINANLCGVAYRGDVCQYAGDPKTDASGATFGAGPWTDRGTWAAATSNYVADDYATINSPDGVPFVWVVPAALVGSVPAGTRPGSTGSTSYWVLDVCLKRIADCGLRFDAAGAGLNFGGFPGAAQVPI